MDKLYVFMDNLDKFKQAFGKTTPTTRNNLAIYITLFVIIGLTTILIIYTYLKNKYNFSTGNYVKKHNFNSFAKSIGLDHDELKYLFNLALKNNVKEPLTCFTNSKLLDEIIKNGLKDIERNEKDSEDIKNSKSAFLLEIKAKIERNSRQNMGIRSTHLLHENQKMVLFAREKGYIYAIIKRVLHDYIIIELMSEKIKSRILSVGEYLKVYFWREEDAGYTFETSVLGYDNAGIKRYTIKHSDRLIRTQKRRYRRVPVNLNGYAIPVEVQITGKTKKYIPKESLAVTCNIKNLSAGGLLMIVNKLRSDDKNFKIVFDLNHHKISVIGKIIRIHHVHEHLFEVTIQFVRMLLNDKNIINKYVYNYMPGYD
jgi:hypothetical protein